MDEIHDHALNCRVEESEGRDPGLLLLAATTRAETAEAEVERLRAEVLPGVDALHRRIRTLESRSTAPWDAWRAAEADVQRLRAYLDDALAVLAAPASSGHDMQRTLAEKIRAALATEVKSNVVTEWHTTYVRSLSAPPQPEWNSAAEAKMREEVERSLGAFRVPLAPEVKP